MSLNETMPLVVKARNARGERDIPPHKWWIDRRTPVGEDAAIYERKPHDGKKYHPHRDVLGNRAPDGSVVNEPRR